MSRRLAPALAATAALALGALAIAGCGEEDEPAQTARPAGEPAATATQAQTGSGSPEASPVEPPAGNAAQGAAASAGEAVGPGGDAAPGAAPPASPEDAIRGVLTAAGSPEEACGSFVTEAFLRDAYGGAQNCLASRRPRALARSVEIAPSGPGRYTVVPDGGTYDGVEIEIRILELDGAPRVDSLVADIPAGP